MACRSGAPAEPEDTVVFPNWVMLHRVGRHTNCAADEDVNNDDTAAAAHTSSGDTCYFSFTLAAPPAVSYLNLHWPERPAAKNLPTRPYVLAADDNLLLLRVPGCHDVPPDLFVYTAGPSSPPSALRLPPFAERADDFVPGRTSIGILRLASADQDRGFIVSDLTVSDNDDDNDPTFARLCVFSSVTGSWRITTKRVPQLQDGGQFPERWSTADVLPFDGRFLCWVDYFSGLVLSDFSEGDSSPLPALHFVPFPVEWYPGRTTARECCPRRFRSVSASHGGGMMRFVHVNNDRHERVCCGDGDWDRDDLIDWHGRPCHGDDDWDELGSKITIWTLNMMDDDGKFGFEWEVHRVINLEYIWMQCSYQAPGIPRQPLPGFPIIAVDDPDVLCCVVREEDLDKAWMIMIDIKYAYLRSCGW